MTEPESQPWQVVLSRAARRALEQTLPEAAAWAAYTFVSERLPQNPYRLGAALEGPYLGQYSAHLGTYRVVYTIDEDTRTVNVLSIRLRADVYGTGR